MFKKIAARSVGFVRKAFYSLMLLSLLLTNSGSGTSTAFAQDGTPPVDTETAPPVDPTGTPEPTATSTEPPPFTPTIAPTEEELSALSLASAGTGGIYRAQVSLKQPLDLTRLADWGITILDEGGGVAIVQVNPLQLSKLARLGFEPTNVDSVDYMLTVHNLSTGEVLSQSDVTASSTEMMALASVDTDSDGLTDTEESWWCTNPNDENSDSPQLSSPTNPNDGDEVNNILRGIIAYGPPFALWPQFTPHNPNGNCPDGDFDGAPDYAEEFMIGTSNLRESSDKDKFDDGQELFGVTYCPASSGPCGYGILPRAEDAAFVSANLPAWVKSPGNSPFVAAFPEPEVTILPSSLNITAVTTITTDHTITEGEEHTYGTSTTKGTSTSLTNTTTWNNWEESSLTSLDINSTGLPAGFKIAGGGISLLAGLGGIALCAGPQVVLCAGVALLSTTAGVISLADGFAELQDERQEQAAQNQRFPCNPELQSCPSYTPANNQTGKNSSTDTRNQNITSSNGNLYSQDPNNHTISIQQQIQGRYPADFRYPTRTETTGSSFGGAQSTTTSEYEEQTISQESTNSFSDSWGNATAIDTGHASDLRFTYNIINNGTEYAREVTSLTFNVYIGNASNPTHTYIAVGSTGQIAKIENLFPGDELTYTSNPISLTLDEMGAIDEGAPIRIIMEDISFGQDQVFYLDALSGSVTVALEDGFDDNDEIVDTFVIPVWDPSDTLQDVIKRYFPVNEDENGNLLSVYTPESSAAIPPLCEQDAELAPNSYTTVFCKHALTGTSWWNIYLSEGLNYEDAFNETLAQPNSAVLVRIVSDRDLDGYNDRNEIRIGTDPDDPTNHPSPNLIAGYTTSCVVNDCTVRMVFQNLGNYDAYGVESIMYSPDGLATITNNTIGGSGRVPASEKVIVGPSDTFQYTKTVSSVEPVIVVSYNDPQGNHRFILPTGNYPAGAKITTLDDVLTALNGKMLLDPGVEISSTSSNQAGFVINSPHPTSITNGKLFVEYIDGNGTVLHEDVMTQNFDSGPTVVSQTINLTTYPPETTILLAFFTDSAGNIIDSSARPLASFGADPSPEANITVDNWEIGAQSLVSVPNPWNLGTFEPGTTLHANLYLTNTGLGDLRYSLTGLGNGWSIAGNPAGTLSPTQQNVFELSFDSAGVSPQTLNHPLYLRTNDPSNGTVTINLQATLGTPAGTASAYQVNPNHPWDQYVYVPGPHAQNDVVNFTHTLADDPSRMFPLYMYNEDKTTLKGVGEYGVDFSGQTAPFGVFGTGADGDLTVTSGQTIYTDNTRSAASATANSAQSNISLSSATGFVAGQEVLIIQVQGTGAGNYEFANIASVASNTLTLTKNLTNTFTVGGSSKAQVIRVMQYHDVTVQSGGVLTAHAWNGSSGGVVAFHATGSVSIDGTISVTGLGFRGGNGAVAGSRQGYQGESVVGNGVQTSSSNGTGGGGGIPDTAAGDGGGGGGGGSHATSGTNGTSKNNGGGGNGAVSTSGINDLSSITFGGGGGEGGADDGGSRGRGGNGGGIAIILGRNLSINPTTGSILAQGENGIDLNASSQSGGDGGGAGGSILLKIQTATINTNRILSVGGIGSHYDSFGGNGGNGRIRIEYNTLSGTTSPTASMQQVNYYSVTGQGAPFGVFGNGSDGDLTVTSGQTIYTDNTRTALASTASSGLTNITLSNATGFTVGKEVLIIQIQGIGAGTYEYAAITNVSGNTLTLSKSLGSTYTTGGSSKVQVIAVPQYHDVTIQSGGVLTAHAWDGSTGGIINFRVNNLLTINNSGTVTASGLGFRGGIVTTVAMDTWEPQGEGISGIGAYSRNANGNGGGGGRELPGRTGGGGGGGNGLAGSDGEASSAGNDFGFGGSISGSSDLTSFGLGGGGGAGGNSDGGNTGGSGGRGGGGVIIAANTIQNNGTITTDGFSGSNSVYGNFWDAGGGGGGAGGSLLIQSQTLSLGSSTVTAFSGNGGAGSPNAGEGGSGGAGGDGRIRIEYGTLSGTTNPTASTQQVNYFNLTGSSSNTLYAPDVIGAGNHMRYQLLYGQRSVNTTGGNQLFTVHLANRQYSAVTLSALMERVVASGSSFDFCLDFGNNGTCDYTANSQAFSGPVRLDSINLASALNAYINTLGSNAPVLTIPIRVNINTPADIFLFNLSAVPGADTDLVPSNFTIVPPNANPPSNIPEGSQVTLSATVANNGTHKAENFTVAFYNGNPATTGVLIGSTFVQSLAAGATSPAQTVTWNTSGLLGSKTIYVKVDAAGAVNESSETNNTASALANIKKKADLLITSLVVPNLRQNETGSAAVSVKNEGEADVTGALVKLYDGSPETGTLVGSTTVNVAQGATTTGQISFSLASAGTHTLSVKVDPANVVLEANESNNTAEATGKVGWDLLTIDAGGAGDLAYDINTGFGWKTQGTISAACGGTAQKTYRQNISTQPLEYQIDNLLPDRAYHLDLTFATCSGDRWLDIFVDNRHVFESGYDQILIPHITSTASTVSILLNPTDYADGSIKFSLQRASGLNGPLVNIIDLQEVEYCYRDSGGSESPWSASNHCGYDSTWNSDGFNGWGMSAEKSMRFSDSGTVKYKFTSLIPSNFYTLRTTYYEGDAAGRLQHQLIDTSSSSNFTLSSTVSHITQALLPANYTDGQVNLSVIRNTAGDAVINEVTLEENTRQENARYPLPGTLTQPGPTPTPGPSSNPQVVLSSFAALWSGNNVHVNWATTTEINNSAFKVYRSTDALAWSEIASVDSTRACGNYTSTTPVPYTFTDTNVIVASTYYYRLLFSGENCGGATALSAQTVRLDPEVVDTPSVSSITRLNPSPTSLTSIGFTVTFTDTVINVDANDFILFTTGVTGASITNVTGSADTYTVTVNTGTGGGTIRLDVKDAASITNPGGISINGLPFTTGQTYVINYKIFLPLILR